MSGSTGDVGLGRDELQKAHHGGRTVEHGLVHVDVDDLRRSPPAGAPRPKAFFGTGRSKSSAQTPLEPVTLVRSPTLTNKGALDRNGDGQRVSMGGTEIADIGLTCCRNTDKTGERHVHDGAEAGRPSLTAASHHRGVGSGCRCNTHLGETLILRGSAPMPAQAPYMAERQASQTPSQTPVEDKGVAKEEDDERQVSQRPTRLTLNHHANSGTSVVSTRLQTNGVRNAGLTLRPRTAWRDSQRSNAQLNLMFHSTAITEAATEATLACRMRFARERSQPEGGHHDGDEFIQRDVHHATSNTLQAGNRVGSCHAGRTLCALG